MVDERSRHSDDQSAEEETLLFRGIPLATGSSSDVAKIQDRIDHQGNGAFHQVLKTVRGYLANRIHI